MKIKCVNCGKEFDSELAKYVPAIKDNIICRECGKKIYNQKSFKQNLWEFFWSCLIMLCGWVGLTLALVASEILSRINKSEILSIIIDQELFFDLFLKYYFIVAVLILILLGVSKIRNWRKKKNECN